MNNIISDFENKVKDNLNEINYKIVALALESSKD